MRLVRAAELTGMPVVTLDEGRIVGEVRDFLFDPRRWRFLGFTLRGRGLISAPLLGVLPAVGIWGLGRDALTIGSEDALLRDAVDIKSALGEHEDAVGHEVVTDTGTPLGRIVDIIIETDSRSITIVGYAFARKDGHQLLVPLLPEAGPDWGEALVVPTKVTGLAAEGLNGFRAALERSRAATGSFGTDTISAEARAVS